MINNINNGKLIFNNDEEVLSYIKNKIQEEKAIEYNQSENEKEKVIFITKNTKNEYEQLEQEKKNYEENYSNLIKEYNKSIEEIQRLNEYNKEIENEINKKQNTINEYVTEREKYIKYINELQEYNEKIILEYQKIKLLLEKQNNFKKYFTNEELEINKNDLFDIINNYNHNQNLNQNLNYEIETINQIFLKDEKKYEIKKEEFSFKNKKKEEENNYIYPMNAMNDKKRASYSEKKYDIKDKVNKSKRDESLSRAMKRINNRRKLDKINEEQNKFRKSKKINGLAGGLQDKIKKNEGKFYVDLEYEKSKEEEINNC